MTTDARSARGEYLKRHTEALIKDIGYAKACEISGKSKATLGRYASSNDENADRSIPVNVLVELELAASIPFVTKALAELQHLKLDYDTERDFWIAHIRANNPSLSSRQLAHLEARSRSPNLATRICRVLGPEHPLWQRDFDSQVEGICGTIADLKPVLDFFLRE